MSIAITSPISWQRITTPFSQLGVIYVLCIPLLASVGTLRGENYSIGGFNYTGFLWVLAMVAGAALIFLEKTLVPGKVIYFPFALWIPWISFVWLSILWVDTPGLVQVRDALQFSMPVLVAAAAALFIQTRSQLATLIRAFYWTIPLLWCSVFVWWAFGLNEDNYVEVRHISLTAVVIGALALTSDRPGRGWWIWGVCLAISFVTGSRTATLAMLLVPIFNPTKRGLLRRVAAAGLMAVVGLAVLMSPIFQERFFGRDTGGVRAIASGEFDSAGRFEAWPPIFEEALTRPWFGHGVGTVERLVPIVWPDIMHPHNDYLRIGYETGIVGLTLFVLVWGAQFAIVWAYTVRTTGVVRQAFAAAWLGLATLFVVAFTDNPVTSLLMFVNPIFALMGAAYAVAHCDARGESLTQDRQPRRGPHEL